MPECSSRGVIVERVLIEKGRMDMSHGCCRAERRPVGHAGGYWLWSRLQRALVLCNNAELRRK